MVGLKSAQHAHEDHRVVGEQGGADREAAVVRVRKKNATWGYATTRGSREGLDTFRNLEHIPGLSAVTHPSMETRAMHNKIRMLLTVAAVVGLMFGIGLLLVPGLLLRMYGLATDGTGELLARLFGVEFIGFNLATWLARDSDARAKGSAARAVVRAHLISETIGALVSAWAASRGLGNPLFWSVVAIYVAFAAAFLRAELASKEHSEAGGRQA
jgi:hypothetical protein